MVTSVLQLPAGKMIFCKWPEGLQAAEPEPRREPRSQDRRDPRSGHDYRGEPRRESDPPAERLPATEPPRPPESPGLTPATPGITPIRDRHASRGD
jgi:hypothetical protein